MRPASSTMTSTTTSPQLPARGAVDFTVAAVVSPVGMSEESSARTGYIGPRQMLKSATVEKIPPARGSARGRIKFVNDKLNRSHQLIWLESRRWRSLEASTRNDVRSPDGGMRAGS